MTLLISKLSLSYLGIWSNKALFCHLEITASALEHIAIMIILVKGDAVTKYNRTSVSQPETPPVGAAADVHKRRPRALRAHTR